MKTLLSIDYLNLEESCGLLESLCMDVEDIRTSLAYGMTSPEEHGGVSCLRDMLTFVEKADYPPFWSQDPTDRAVREKGFDRCKAAVIKAIVEVSGDEKNTDVLWDDSDPQKPGGVFVEQMVRWIREHKDDGQSQDRDDLIICATLSLGNIVRKGVFFTRYDGHITRQSNGRRCALCGCCQSTDCSGTRPCVLVGTWE